MTLVWRPGYGGAAVSDPDAQAYLQAVEVADNQALEQGVQQAVNQFVIGCKADGIWDAIKASCILAGARTLDGALVPLVKQPADSAPARFGTEGGWNYTRKTGLQGNGTDNYINSGRNNNADPQDSNHNALYLTAAAATGVALGTELGTPTTGNNAINAGNVRNRTNVSFSRTIQNGLEGTSRAASPQYTLRSGGVSTTVTESSQTPENSLVLLFRGGSSSSTHRISFYSIGESLDLAALDTRVSALITAIGAAIP